MEIIQEHTENLSNFFSKTRIHRGGKEFAKTLPLTCEVLLFCLLSSNIVEEDTRHEWGAPIGDAPTP